MQRPSTYQDQKSDNNIQLDINFKMSDTDILYALNLQNYHQQKNDFELPNQNQLPEIVQVIDMSNDDGIIKWKVLIKGKSDPEIISHSELRLRNPQLMIDYYQKALSQRK